MKRLESPIHVSVFCVTRPEGDATPCLPLSHLLKVKMGLEQNRKMRKANKGRELKEISWKMLTA